MLTKIIRSRKKLRIISLVTAIVIMTVIFVLSAQNGSASDNVSISFAALMFGDADFAVIVNVLIREIAHAVEYAALGFFVYLFASTFSVSEKVKCIGSFLFSAFYAGTDELHQYFVPGRACRADDVIIDSLGALLAVFLAHLILKAVTKKELEASRDEAAILAGTSVLNAFSAYITNGDYKFIPESTEEFEAFSDCAFKQKLMPMVIKSVVGTEQTEQAYGALKFNVIRQVVFQSRKTADFLDIYAKLCENGITPLCIKGIICRSLYPEPDNRASGDEDILVKENDFDAAADFLEKNGFVRDKTEDKPFEIGFTNKINGSRIELHKALFSESESFFSDFNKALGNLFENPTAIDYDGVKIYAPEWNKHFLYILLHSFKHFIHSGVGIRQICDLAMIAKSREINWDFISSECKKLGIFGYFNAVMTICGKYFGLDLSQLKAVLLDFDESVDVSPMLEDMLGGGIYGSESVDRQHTATITLNKFSASRDDKHSSFLSSVFPSAESMKSKYVFLKKHPALLPAAWVMRIFSYLNSEHDSSKTLALGKKRIKMLKKYGIILK